MPLQRLLKGTTEGYAWTKGVHLYSELRPADGLQVAESEETAQRFLRIIEDYVRAGVQAALIFEIELLEVQGTVLHFHLEGAITRETAKKALSFSHIFTKVLYETLAEEMGSEWNGFAICMDHGPAIIVRHGQASNSSAISLGEAANKPAKRLLYGKTEAGHAEYPESWTGKSSDHYVAINLRDREKAPLLHEYENAALETKFREILNEYRLQRTQGSIAAKVPLIRAADRVDGFSTDHPLRIQAFCMRADLDGFAKQVKAAFSQGAEAVEAIAIGFIKIMQFGEFFEKQHPGSVRLPWAGDCATFLFPAEIDLESLRGQKWIAIVEQWQTFASATDEGKQNRWSGVFKDVNWSVGMTFAEHGTCLIAPILAVERRFLIGAGAPLTFALDAQNIGRADDTVIHSSDHQSLYAPIRKLFNKVDGTEFWLGHNITMEKAAQAVIDAGKSANVQTYADKIATVAVPLPRPHCK